MKKLIIILSFFVLFAGCTSQESTEIISENVSFHEEVIVEDVIGEYDSLVCLTYGENVLSDCNNNFELVDKLYYYTSINSEILNLFVYHNNTLYNEYLVDSKITEINLPNFAGGNWSFELLKDSTVVNDLDIEMSYGVPQYLTDVSTNSINNDGDSYRDAIEISGLELININSDSIPINGNLKVTLYGIILNQTNDRIARIVFLDEWNTNLTNHFQETLTFDFTDNTTNVYDYDYGQLYLNLSNSYGSYSNFNPEVNLFI